MLTVTAVSHLERVSSRLLAVFLVLHGIAHYVGMNGNIGLIRHEKPAALLADSWSLSNTAALGCSRSCGRLAA